MTDTSNWEYYYKLNPDGTPNDSNLLYSPKVNPEQNVMCMHYVVDQVYRNGGNHIINDDLLQWFFDREVRFLQELSHLKTTPEVYEVDRANRKVFIEWNKETLSQIVFNSNRNLDDELPDWQEQIRNFLISTKQNEFYKMALYPHCFYINKDNVLKTIDYYSVVPYAERFIERKTIEGIIGPEGAYRFNESTDDSGVIDFKKFFEITMTRHLKMYWPNSPFPGIFEEIYYDK